jgi:hypothetical protein
MQGELNPESASEQKDKPSLFERARARWPGCKFILAFDRRATSKLKRLLIAIEASSPWYELLPDEQMTELHDSPDPMRRLGAWLAWEVTEYDANTA